MWEESANGRGPAALRWFHEASSGRFVPPRAIYASGVSYTGPLMPAAARAT